MTYIDHHVHTKLSPDSNADIVRYITNAKELGLKHILFTDHMDFGALDPYFKDIDYDEYFRVMKELESRYEIPIMVGVEIGYERKHKNEIEEFLSKYNFDFIISSIHYGHGLDFYTGEFFEGKTKDEAYFEYFNLVLEMVENFTNYDVVGHLDYITRYGPYIDKHYKYEDYEEVIDDILKAIIKNNRGIEVNTSGLRQGLDVTFPKDNALQRYKELGGKIITVGSDSHFNDEYQADFKKVINKLNLMGFEVKNYQRN